MFINSMFTLSISTIAMYCNHHQHNDVETSVDLVRANATWLRIARLDFSYDQILNSPSILTSPFEQNSLECDVKTDKTNIVLRCYNE